MAESMKILEFSRFMGVLKHLKRTGWVQRGVEDPECVASHMYSTERINRDRCIKMALVHDMAESIAGDITPACGISDAEKFNLEKDGMAKLASLVPKDIGTEFTELWLEYEKQETAESKIVKDLDKFDMIAQAFEYEEKERKRGNLQEFFDSTKGKFSSDLVKDWVKILESKRNSTTETTPSS